LVALAGELLPGTAPDAVGLLSPGIVDVRARRTVFAANLGLHDAALPDLLSARLGVPVGFGHDVGLAAEAEMAQGAGAHGAESVLAVMIGTGIASTAFVRGARVDVPGAGELGHVPVPGGRACACGATGCLETVASAAAIAAAYTRETGTEVAGAIDVVRALEAGDAAAERVWATAVQALAFSLHWAVGLLGTQRVILGGGLSGAGEALVGPLREALGERLSFMQTPEIVTARLGADAGLRGAGIVAAAVLQESA
jgi:glucokinase